MRGRHVPFHCPPNSPRPSQRHPRHIQQSLGHWSAYTSARTFTWAHFILPDSHMRADVCNLPEHMRTFVSLSCPRWDWRKPSCLSSIHNSCLSIPLIMAFKKYPLPCVCPFHPPFSLIATPLVYSLCGSGLLSIYLHCSPPLPLLLLSPFSPYDKGLETDNRGGSAAPTSPRLCGQMTERRWIVALPPNFAPMAWVTALFCLELNVLGAAGRTTGKTRSRELVNGGGGRVRGEEWRG